MLHMLGGDEALLKAKRQKRKEAEAATPKEAADSDVKKEEVKDELKKEEKLEVKTEVKEEEEDEDADGALNDIMEAATSDWRSKKRRKCATEGDLPEMPDVDTDTEYDKVPLSQFPAALRVEGCDHGQVNGLYRRFRTASRGRPAYCKTTRASDKKIVYMFWAASKWCIGFEFGAKRCIATLPEIENSVEPPYEPCPGVWKVVEKHRDKEEEKKPAEKVDCPIMRVIDEAVSHLSHELKDFEQPIEPGLPPEILAKLTEKAEKRSQKAETKPSSSRTAKESKETPQPASPKATKSSSAKAKSPKKASPVKGLKKMGDDEADMVEAAAQENSEDSDDDPKAKPQSSAPSAPSDSNESVSGSESEEESSSSDSSQSSEAEKDEEDIKVMSKTARDLVMKLKQLNPTEGKDKAVKLFNSLRGRLKAGKGCPNDLDVLNIERVRLWCKRRMGLTLPEVRADLYDQQKAQTTDGSQPRTPPLDSRHLRDSAPSAQMPHRTEHPKKSVLRKDNVRKTGRVSFAAGDDNKPYVMEHKIDSYKAEGDRLWFHQPGFLVQCDQCHKTVPQQMGLLQGAAKRSQFAQSRFLCQQCSSNPNPNADAQQ